MIGNYVCATSAQFFITGNCKARDGRVIFNNFRDIFPNVFGNIIPALTISGLIIILIIYFKH